MKLVELKNLDPHLDLVFSVDDQAEISTIADLHSLQDGALFFLNNETYLKKYLTQKSSAKLHFVLSSKLSAKVEEIKNFALSVSLVKNPALLMSLASRPFYESKIKKLNFWHDSRQSAVAQIDPSALIAQGVFLADNVVVKAGAKLHAGVVVHGPCVIEEGAELFANVTIYPFCKIGKNVRIHSGSVIGADGFGYNFDQGIHHKVWHFGGVIIGDHVEIGANSCIDSATFSATHIGSGSKIDNHVQIGHNCRLGAGVIVCGHVAIGGSTSLGDFTVVGGKAGFGDGLTLGKACQVAGGALVNCDWPDGSIVAGHPARPVKEWLKGVAWLRKESLKGTR